MNAQQPQQMKGNPNARYSFKQLTIGIPFQNEKNHWLVNLRYDDVIICTIYGIDKMEALDNAERMKMAVNMHDELANISRQLLNELIYSLANQCKVLGMSDEQTADSINKNSLVIKSRELLKQAEQK